MTNTRKVSIIISVIVVIVGIVLLIAHARKTFGYVTINFDLPNIQNISATVNSKKLPISKLMGTYKVSSGQESLKATKPNYQPFTTTFSLGSGRTVIVNVAMQSTAPQNPGIASTQLKTSLTKYLPVGFSLQQATYFYNNTWVVASVVTPAGDGAVLVAKYVGGSTVWQIALGPGTIFTPEDLNTLPVSVATYMSQQGYVLEEIPVNE